MNARAPNERPTDTGAHTHKHSKHTKPQPPLLSYNVTRLVYWALTTVLSVGLRLLGPLRVVGLRPKSHQEAMAGGPSCWSGVCLSGRAPPDTKAPF